MKEIKAFVKDFKVNDIVYNLIQEGFPNITISAAEGTGTFQVEEPAISTLFSIADSPIAKIELVCANYEEGKIVDIITKYGRTGNQGDGLIYISDVTRAVRIKDGLRLT